MRSEWERVRLGDLLTVKHGFAFKGECFSEQDNKKIVVTPGNFEIRGGFKQSKNKYYKGIYPINYELKPDNIIVSMTDLSKSGDTLGYAALVPDDGNIYLHNQRIGLVENISNNAHKDFLYWLMRSPHYQKFIVNSSSGSTVKHTSPKSIYKFEFFLPPLEEQKAIAGVLSAIDYKIELNNKINKILESQTQAIFKRWFVDFEFPDENGNPYKSSGGEMIDSELGEIPKEWKVATLGEFFPVITGKKNVNVTTPKGQYPFFSCSQLASWTDEYSFDAKAILLAGNGDFNIKWYSGKFEAYQRTYVLIPFDEMNLGWLFFLMRNFLDEITSKSRGSVISFITKGNIENYQIATPQKANLNTAIFNDFLTQIQAKNIENQKLTELRDYLLPKLMSGEVRVNCQE